MVTDPRARLIDAGTRLLERDGPAALQARKVTAEAGVSTMAVYTYFDGMSGLVGAIVAAAFERFSAALASAPTTDDPMADFFLMGYAYRRFALDHPQRYRLMFGLAAPQPLSTPPTGIPSESTTFGQLITAVQRIAAADRIRADDPVVVAYRIWSMIHGVVLLEIVGALESDGRALTSVLGPMTVDLFVGMGDSRERAEASLRRARETAAAESSSVDR